ncbi:MAG TPA: hypothetical protein VJ933_09330 [Phaeodactylibacter sp.]|nr:hypothetical protein [Phaeodactylibacter sp.]
MKKIITVLLAIALSCWTTSYAAMDCSGACISGCISWYIQYETDCQGNITSYEAWHYNGGINFDYSNDLTNPEFVGMSAASIGCDYQPCI